MASSGLDTTGDRRRNVERRVRPARSLRAVAVTRPPGTLDEDVVRECTGEGVRLEGGEGATVAPSCLVRPEPADRILVWRSVEESIVVAVLARAGGRDLAIGAQAGLRLQAPRIVVGAESLHLLAGELLTSARAVHEVSRVITRSAELRVAEIGTDIRRAATARDEIEGTFVQRLGSWVSDTVREARIAARAMLFG